MRLVQPPQMGTAPSHRRLRVQHEFSQFSTHPKTLRVSDLLGLQRSSWWISLPLRYGIPMCCFGGNALVDFAELVSGEGHGFLCRPWRRGCGRVVLDVWI